MLILRLFSLFLLLLFLFFTCFLCSLWLSFKKNHQIYSTYYSLTTKCEMRNTSILCPYCGYIDIMYSHCVRAQKFNKFFFLLLLCVSLYLSLSLSVPLSVCLHNMYTKTLCERAKWYKSKEKTREWVKEYYMYMFVCLPWSGPLANTWPRPKPHHIYFVHDS